MKTGYIIYSRRSCETGKLLAEYLSANRVGNVKWRRSFKKRPRKTPDVVIRWGSSEYEECCADALVLNEHCNNASNKLEMMQRIQSLAPPVVFNAAGFSQVANDEGKAYIRGRNGVVRLDSQMRSSDLYATSPIDKTREFRVHVFDGKVIGVYEKVPYTEDNTILKNENSEFVRLDQANIELMEKIKGVRTKAKKAVEACSLLFGGVDVIIGANKKKYVLEVNSAPSLNSLNIERWSRALQTHLV